MYKPQQPGLSCEDKVALLKEELQKQLDSSGIRIKNYFGVLTCEECDRSGHGSIIHRSDCRTGGIRAVLEKCK